MEIDVLHFPFLGVGSGNTLGVQPPNHKMEKPVVPPQHQAGLVLIFIETGGCANNMSAQASHQRSTEVLTQQRLVDKLGTKLRPLHQAVGLARKRWMKMDVDDDVDKLYVQL